MRGNENYQGTMRKESKFPKILLAEDDLNLGFIIKDNLVLQGYEVFLCHDGYEAVACFDSTKFDLCILDVMLPKRDGFAIAKEIRKENQQIPILFLTARSLQEDKLMGFKCGGDDYITKPFSIEELILRIEVFLKRAGNIAFQHHPTYKIGTYNFEPENMFLIHGNERKKLTRKEADLLLLFIQNQNQVIRREKILKELWGDDDYFMGRSLDVFISKLRKYLASDPGIKILNFHGVGFQLVINEP